MIWLETYAKTHLFYIALIAVGVLSFHCWLQEHDARVVAESKVAQAEVQVANLQKQIDLTKQQAAQQVQIVTKVVHDAIAPSQVIAAMPDLTNLPLQARVVPDNPLDVEVAAQPLAQLAGDDKTAQINLAACQQVTTLQSQQLAAKNTEIATLKKKPGFFKRVLGVVKAVGVGVGIGLVVGDHL